MRLLAYIVMAIAFVGLICYVWAIGYTKTESKVPAFIRGVWLIFLTALLTTCFYCFDRTERVMCDYLNSKIQIDTIAVSPKGEILKVQLKYK